MKKWLAIVATTALLGSGFAAEQYDHEIAFARGRRQESGEGKDRAKFFFGYKLFLTQPGDNAPSDNYATITDANMNITNENANYDWDFGHFGVIGVQLPKTMFKLFFEGWFFDNKKNRTVQAGANSIGVGSAFINNDLGGITPTQVKSRAKNDLYIVNFFVSYAAYRKGNFFFIPYVGPRYAQGKHNLKADFSDATNTVTKIRNEKREGFGVVMAFMVKYFFTSRFYAFGDYRYSILFDRSTIFNSSQSDLQQGFVPTTTTNINSGDTDEMFELAFGAGFMIVNRSNWNLSVDACYKMIRWEDADQNHQSLGLGVMLGF